MGKVRVLLAEDDFDFGSILKQYLEIHDFEILWAKDGLEALEIFEEQSQIAAISICVLDVMMPKMDGFTLAEKLIEIDPMVPFVFLTAKKMKEDRLKGLKLGADDYIVKPFEADILVLRLKNILKRTKSNPIVRSDEKSVKIGNYLFDALNHQLKLDSNMQKLTEKEAQLIAFFLENKNQLVKREDLLKGVWGRDDFFSGRSMDVFISRLRKYFKDDTRISIESVRGVGLIFQIHV